MNDKELARWEQNENYAVYWRRFNNRARREAANSTRPHTWMPDPRVAQAVAKIMAKLRKAV